MWKRGRFKKIEVERERERKNKDRSKGFIGTEEDGRKMATTDQSLRQKEKMCNEGKNREEQRGRVVKKQKVRKYCNVKLCYIAYVEDRRYVRQRQGVDREGGW